VPKSRTTNAIVTWCQKQARHARHHAKGQGQGSHVALLFSFFQGPRPLSVSDTPTPSQITHAHIASSLLPFSLVRAYRRWVSPDRRRANGACVVCVPPTPSHCRAYFRLNLTFFARTRREEANAHMTSSLDFFESVSSCSMDPSVDHVLLRFPLG
jgi:hypothetical protein